MDGKIVIKKKKLKGDDGYKTFSVRIKNTYVEELDKLVQKTNLSRNELIKTFIVYGIENYVIEDDDSQN